MRDGGSGAADVPFFHAGDVWGWKFTGALHSFALRPLCKLIDHETFVASRPKVAPSMTLPPKQSPPKTPKRLSAKDLLDKVKSRELKNRQPAAPNPNAAPVGPIDIQVVLAASQPVCLISQLRLVADLMRS